MFLHHAGIGSVGEDIFLAQNGGGPHKLSVSERIENLKKDRLAIVEILQRAGSTLTIPQPADSKTRHASEQLQNPADGRKTLPLWALKGNLTAGRPEVLELLCQGRARPRSLQSTCRLVVRRRLSRPILFSGNVDKLPLPRVLKQYVAMETLGFSLTEPY